MPGKKKVKIVEQIPVDIHQTDGHTFQKGVSIYGCGSHYTSCLRLKPSTKNNPCCKSCGVKIQGQRGFLECLVKGCFHLCSSCKVCRNNHFLGKVYSLRHYDSLASYSNNLYSCEICKAQKEVDSEKGIHFCSGCNYSVCPECTSHEDLLWTQ